MPYTPNTTYDNINTHKKYNTHTNADFFGMFKLNADLYLVIWAKAKKRHSVPWRLAHLLFVAAHAIKPVLKALAIAFGILELDRHPIIDTLATAAIFFDTFAF